MDFFSVPAGTIPQEDPEGGVSGPTLPSDIFEHRGKWVALDNRDAIIAIRDTRNELREEFGVQHPGIAFFHVPASDVLIF